MEETKKYKFWFVVGSQHLYGLEVLKEVEVHGKMMVDGFNSDKSIPLEVVFKGVITTPESCDRYKYLQPNLFPHQ